MKKIIIIIVVAVAIADSAVDFVVLMILLKLNSHFMSLMQIHQWFLLDY